MRIAFLTLLCIASISSSHAQAIRSPQERAQRIMNDPSFQTLKLTNEQKPKVFEILVAQNKSLDSLITTIPPGNNSQQAIIKAMAPKRLSIISANDKKIMDLLNDEQKKAYEDYMKKRPPGSVFMGQAGPGVPR